MKIVKSRTLASSLCLDGGHHRSSPSILYSKISSRLLSWQFSSTHSLSSDVSPFLVELHKFALVGVFFFFCFLNRNFSVIKEKKSKKTGPIQQQLIFNRITYFGSSKISTPNVDLSNLNSVSIASFIDKRSHWSPA